MKNKIIPQHLSESNEWYTPPYIIEKARAFLGVIDVDPASCHEANLSIKARIFYDKNTNGLIREWRGNIWLNPPYGKNGGVSNQKIWSEYLINQYEKGYVKNALILVNASVGTKWFDNLLDYPVCLLERRVSFISHNGIKKSPPNGNAIFYLGNNLLRFANVFYDLGRVLVEVE